MFTRNFAAYRAEVTSAGGFALHLGDTVLHSPESGYWQIAVDWHHEKPCSWYTSPIISVEGDGDTFILQGTIKLPQGVCSCRDICCFQRGVLDVTREWEYHGEALPHATLAVEFILPGNYPRLLMPGIFYYGNPSGKRSGKVPLIPCRKDGAGFFEEHRFPVPFVSAETDCHSMAALHTFPSQLVSGNRKDLWWSLGAKYGEDHVKLAAYSGFIHGNGCDGAVKASQNQWKILPGCCIKLTDGQKITKNFKLQIAPVSERGSGFIPALTKAMDFMPLHTYPADEKLLIRKKYDYALKRYISIGTGGGNLIRPVGDSPNAVVYGWTGRSETLALACRILGEKFGDTEAETREKEIFDLLVSAPFDKNGFSVRYEYPDEVWSSDRNFVAQGQALETFTFALLQKIRRKENIPPHWMDFLCTSCDLFTSRVMDSSWHPLSTAEAFLGAPLINAHLLTGRNEYLNAALKLADLFIARHLTMDEPYWGGTLDAKCEDKEGAAAALAAFFRCWEVTGKSRYLHAAYHAAMVLLTYLQLWDIPMPPDSELAKRDFRSSGWSAVSVQNMHLDVYGVWVSPLLYQLGLALEKRDLCRVAKIMFINCAQLMDEKGSHGEQIFQTNYAQGCNIRVECDSMRGKYAENWQVFWMTAAFLDAASRFEIMNTAIAEV